MSLTMCRGCGQPLAAGVSFCGTCGVRAAAVDSQSTVQAPTSAPAPAVYAQQTAPVMPAQPAVYGVPASRSGVRGMALVAILGLLLSVGARVAYGAMSSDDGPGDLVAQLPIDPQGGKSTFDNGNGEIEVPKGAVSKPETVKIYKRVIRERVQATSPTGGAPLIIPPGTLFVYTFGPTTIRLNAPIIIRFTLPTGQQGIVFVTTRGQIRFLPGVGAGRMVTIVLRSFNLAQPGAVQVVN